MDPINEIELEDCPVCRGAGYIEDEQGWCMYACCLNCGTETAHVSYKTPGGAAGGRPSGCLPVEHRQGDPQRHV